MVPFIHGWLIPIAALSAMQTREGTADLICIPDETTKPENITPSNHDPGEKDPPPSRPQTRLPPVPPSPTDRPSTDNLFLDSRAALPDPCRKEPSVRQPGSASASTSMLEANDGPHPANDWPRSLPGPCPIGPLSFPAPPPRDSLPARGGCCEALAPIFRWCGRFFRS